jgi:large subunit ribosomal protein L18
MAKMNPRLAARLRRKRHIRKTISGSAGRPRLCVNRSATNIYAQLIDDVAGVTLAAASSLSIEMGEVSGGNKEGAALVGKHIGELAIEHNITEVVFDRNGHLYHGRVAALADAAREAGLKF